MCGVDVDANAGLQLARERLERVKREHPGITYADLYTLAGVVAVEEMGGPKIKWSPGRTDAKVTWDGARSRCGLRAVPTAGVVGSATWLCMWWRWWWWWWWWWSSLPSSLSSTSLLLSLLLLLLVVSSSSTSSSVVVVTCFFVCRLPALQPTDPIPPDGRLPDAKQGADHLRTIFYRMGFNDQVRSLLSGDVQPALPR